MDLEAVKKLIKNRMAGHAAFIAKVSVAERYYRGQNDILFLKRDEEKKEQEPLRQADNRIPHPFHQLLVNQKVAYLFTAPPVFDTQNDAANQAIVDALGDEYAKKLKDLGINSSNAGVAWAHIWEGEDRSLQWAVVPSVEIMPLWSSKLDHKLLGVLRAYRDMDDNGELWDVYEYWNEEECQAYRKRTSDELAMLAPWNCFGMAYSDTADMDNVYKHNLGRVPFIPFANNNIRSDDLQPIKALIDTYDKTYSGFMNDLEDIQEVIFVLTNYGDEDLGRFLRELKRYKTISMDSAGVSDKSGVQTLTIDIPIEARDKMLELTRKAIFDMGQGVDPQQQGLDATSGEAMKFLYALLELKAGLLETEFRLSLNELVRAILSHANMQVDTITQTWTRTSIRNDSELVDMCSKSNGIISRKTIIRNHPFVENAEEEEKLLAEEEAAQAARDDPYDDVAGE